MLADIVALLREVGDELRALRAVTPQSPEICKGSRLAVPSLFGALTKAYCPICAREVAVEQWPGGFYVAPHAYQPRATTETTEVRSPGQACDCSGDAEGGSRTHRADCSLAAG